MVFQNVIGVIIGGTAGHALCTGLAVIGGRFVAQRISMRTGILLRNVKFVFFQIRTLFVEFEWYSNFSNSNLNFVCTI